MLRWSRIAYTAFALAIASWAVNPSPVLAQGGTASPFSLGIQSSWPSYGISGRYEVSERAMVQGVIGALGTVTNFSGRFLFDLQKQEKYDVYSYGAAGLWRWDGGRSYSSESVVGFGGGVGLELDLRKLFSPGDESFPPLFWNIELGAIIANFDNYNFSAFSFGGGLHWAF